jgi:hypothetical protein
MSDAEFNKAAVFIAKLLIRTREGKIHWEYTGTLSASKLLTGIISYKAALSDGLETHLQRDVKGLEFKLLGPPAVPDTLNPLADILGMKGGNEIISVSLSHSYGQVDSAAPESVVYCDLAELIFLAENPKSVSDDLHYKQAMSYLDKLTA